MGENEFADVDAEAVVIKNEATIGDDKTAIVVDEVADIEVEAAVEAFGRVL